MSCNHPLKAFWTGNYTENNKKEYMIVNSVDLDMVSYSFARKKGFQPNLAAPHISKDGEVYLTEPLNIPCGHCLGCRMSKSKEWTTRICLEATKFKYSYFITLTYSDECLPFDGELKKEDLKNFIRRLRRRIECRYFACGEYGSSEFGTKRPHYHLIILSNDDIKLKPLLGSNKFVSDLIKESWCFGLHEVSIADDGCIAYTAGYVYKKQVAVDEDNHKMPPFVIMSDKPAFGAWYLQEHLDSILSSHLVYYKGKKKPVFRWIWKKLSESMDIQPIKDELIINAGRSVDKLKWYFDTSYFEEAGQKVDELLIEYLKTHRKEKI